jgi:hypothetical protein
MEAFIPAHSISNTKLLLDDHEAVDYPDIFCPYIVPEKEEVFGTSGFMPGFESSGVEMASNESFHRGDVDSLDDSLLSASASPVIVHPRNSLRRRSFQSVLPRSGLFIRDGFNMPSPYANIPTTTSPSGYIPLGFIPSSMTFQGITEYSAIPEVYSKCEDLNSSSTFFDVPTSASFPCRGETILDPSTCHYYVSRGDMHPVIGVMRNVMYDRAVSTAVEDLTNEAFASSYSSSAHYADVPGGLANASSMPTAFRDYLDFSFTDGVNRLYRDYTQEMNKHQTRPDILDTDGGFDIIAHTYGPLLYNGKFAVDGSAGSTYITTSVNVNRLNSNQGTGLFSSATADIIQASTVGTDLNIGGSELRYPHVFSGVELVITSSTDQDNSFVAYKLDPSVSRKNLKGFAIERGIIESRAVNGFPRMRFDMGAYDGSSNRFLREHEFELTVSSFIGHDGSFTTGGGTVGVWIHTYPEQNRVWSWTKNRRWEETFTSSLTIPIVQNTLSHKFTVPKVVLTEEDTSGLATPCVVTSALGSQSRISIDNITASFFNKHTIKFDTLNRKIKVPNYYFKINPQLHRSTQRYVVEVFLFPSIDKTQYGWFDKVSIIDTTEAVRASELTSGELLDTIKYFNSIHAAKASRVASITSGTFEASGGSRLNYRQHPAWDSSGTTTAFSKYTNLDLKN